MKDKYFNTKFGLKPVPSIFLDITLFIHSPGYHTIEIAFRSFFLLEVYENPYIKRRTISSNSLQMSSAFIWIISSLKKVNILTTLSLSFLKLLCLNYSYIKWWSNFYIVLLTLIIAQREPKDIWEECASFLFGSLDVLMLH